MDDFLTQRKSDISHVSTKVSNILRQFIIAGVGIVWLFRIVVDDAKIQIDHKLLIALVLFVSAILVELLHYLIEITIKAVYLTGNLKNRQIPTWLSWFPWLLWIVKILCVFVAYVQIGIFLWSRIIF